MEECVSDIFLFVWNNIKDYDEIKGNFKSWLAIIARSKAIDLRRKISKRNETCLKDDIVDNASLEDLLLNKELRQKLIKAIQDLGELDAKIFLYRYFYYETIENIMDKLNLSRQAVDNRLWRGKKKIRDLLSSNDNRL